MNAWQSRAGIYQIHGQNNYKEQRKSKCDANNTKDKTDSLLILSDKVWNPPQCHCDLRTLDLRTNKNLQRLATRTIPNQTKSRIS